MYLLMKAKHHCALEQHELLLEQLKIGKAELKNEKDEKEASLDQFFQEMLKWVKSFWFYHHLSLLSSVFWSFSWKGGRWVPHIHTWARAARGSHPGHSRSFSTPVGHSNWRHEASMDEVVYETEVFWEDFLNRSSTVYLYSLMLFNQ